MESFEASEVSSFARGGAMNQERRASGEAGLRGRQCKIDS